MIHATGLPHCNVEQTGSFSYFVLQKNGLDVTFVSGILAAVLNTQL